MILLEVERSMVNKMATKTLWVANKFSSILSLLLSIQTVCAYYCDNDRCTEEEYCCGDNTCCPSYKVWDLWYFWFGVLFFLLLLSMCAWWRYKHISSGGLTVHGYNYTALQKVDAIGSYPELSTTGRYVYSGDKLIQPPIGTPPPPYSYVSAGSVKVAAPPPSYAQVIGMRDIH